MFNQTSSCIFQMYILISQHQLHASIRFMALFLLQRSSWSIAFVLFHVIYSEQCLQQGHFIVTNYDISVVASTYLLKDRPLDYNSNYSYLSHPWYYHYITRALEASQLYQWCCFELLNVRTLFATTQYAKRTVAVSKIFGRYSICLMKAIAAMRF